MYVPQRHRDRLRPKPVPHLSCTAPASIQRNCPAEQGGLYLGQTSAVWQHINSSIVDGVSVEGNSNTSQLGFFNDATSSVQGLKAYTERKEG